ncbi:hypothetical protein QBC44DRAFT_366743 [Cladorrhinum sp. PSN332]|nr:hypothetical protein QBC44DRAFT_366743 [Cladorrhinum sp. PSN332]
MGSAHKVISASLRVFEFGFCVIILGILARFFYLLDQIDGPTDSRLVYAISMAAISVVLAIILFAPTKFSFWCFPLDIALFICWIVVFALLQDLTGTQTCNSGWFRGYWTVNWSTSTGTTTVGLYTCTEYYGLDVKIAKMARRLTWWKKPKQQALEKGAPESKEQEQLPKVGPPRVQNGSEV